MGTFSVEVEISTQDRDRWEAMVALVDTGASITSAPASVLIELGVKPATTQIFQFAQGETRVMEVGYAWVRFEGQEILTQVLFNDDGTPPLLGAMALEGAYMGVDPIAQRLIPVPGSDDVAQLTIKHPQSETGGTNWGASTSK